MTLNYNVICFSKRNSIYPLNVIKISINLNFCCSRNSFRKICFAK